MSEERAPPDDPRNHWTELGRAVQVPPTWLIDNLIVAGLNIIGGPPKSTKSTWTYAIASMLAGVQDCLVLPPWCRKVKRTGTVLMLSAEATPGEIKYTIKNSLSTTVAEDIPVLVNENPWEFQLDGPPGTDGISEGQRRLLSWLEYLNPVATILDPFRDYISCNENDAAEVIQALRPIRDWHHKHDAAFIIVHHSSKRPYEGRKEKMEPSDLRGSSALFGKADGVLMMTPRGDPNPVEVFSWFKRGAVWNRTIQPAVFGATEATEVLEVLDRKVFASIKIGVPSIEALIRQVSASAAHVDESLHRLRRNGWIGKRNGLPVALKDLPKEKK